MSIDDLRNEMISSFCTQLFDDIEKSIKADKTYTHGDFSKNSKFHPLMKYKLDFTHCPQYNKVVDSIYGIKYRPVDIKYPYNKYYQINWNPSAKELAITFSD